MGTTMNQHRRRLRADLRGSPMAAFPQLPDTVLGGSGDCVCCIDR